MVKGGKCTMEKISPRPRTVTIPPSKACTSGTTSESLRIPLIEDNPRAWVFCKRTVDEKMIGSVTEGASSVRAVAGQVSEATAVGAIISDTAVLRVAGCPLTAAGTFIFRAVDTEMTCGMTLKTTSLPSRDGFWAQAGIARCNSCWKGSRATLKKGRSSVSEVVRRGVKQGSGSRLRRWGGVFEARGWGRRVWRRDG